jgi:hypothetical protein
MQSQPAFSNSGIGERYCLVVKTSTVAISLSTGARCCRSYEFACLAGLEPAGLLSSSRTSAFVARCI